MLRRMVDSMDRDERQQPRLSLNRGFVVQSGPTASAPGNSLRGRMEHASSGEVLDFAGGSALLQFIDSIVLDGTPTDVSVPKPSRDRRARTESGSAAQGEIDATAKW